MRKPIEKMRKAETEAITAALQEAIECGANDARLLFNALLTEQEKMTIGRRLLIANLILHGKTQMEINNLLNVSPNTYTKVRRWLDDSLLSYAETNNVERERLKRKPVNRKEYPNRYSFADLKNKFPLHFLLFTVSEKVLTSLKQK